MNSAPSSLPAMVTLTLPKKTVQHILTLLRKERQEITTNCQHKIEELNAKIRSRQHRNIKGPRH